jgi:GDP-4-dehydro-6-deoxy-D-mannose reductase
MTSLLTGASGFVGRHMAEHLLGRGDTVIALVPLQPAAGDGEPPPGVAKVTGDILDAAFLRRVIAETRPDEIYHLAAQSLPTVSWQDPVLTQRVNVEGTLHVLEGVRAAGLPTAIVVASSSAIYAQRKDGAPIREDDPCGPSSPYGVSKLAADHFARLYAGRYGLRVFRARPFFLIGPRKTGDVCSDWARNIVAIEQSTARELVVGNLDIVRDFLHVGDGVEALATVAAKGAAGEAYNISSGRGWALADVLRALTGLSRAKVSVRVDPGRIRPMDERVKVGDSSRLRALGWRESRGVERALAEILEYWRGQP